jgi:hypothetical protein
MTPPRNPWNAFNLRASPYWQDPLGNEDPEHSLDLFVGRDRELTQLTDALFGAGASSSRRAIHGSSGVGKTTLVKRLKANAQAKGYLTTDSFVPVLSDDTAESLFGRFLGGVYDTLFANRPHVLDHPAMRSAQVLVRAARELMGGGGLSLAGVGVSASRSASTTVPRDLLLDGPRVLRDLMSLVRESGAAGLVVHVNNLENLSEADVERAAVILRDLRDPLLMHPGLHVVLVGTTEAVQTMVLTHAQVRSTFALHAVEPLSPSEVHALLERRYRHLALSPKAPVLPPVEPAAVATLHGWYRGDLRGLLKALEDGVTPNIGLLDTLRPMRLEELVTTLRPRYIAELSATADEARVTQLARWGARDAATTHTQKSLATLWKLGQSGVSQALGWHMRAGYVAALPREGVAARHYALTGLGRVIAGAVRAR